MSHIPLLPLLLLLFFALFASSVSAIAVSSFADLHQTPLLIIIPYDIQVLTLVVPVLGHLGELLMEEDGQRITVRAPLTTIQTSMATLCQVT